MLGDMKDPFDDKFFLALRQHSFAAGVIVFRIKQFLKLTFV